MIGNVAEPVWQGGAQGGLPKPGAGVLQGLINLPGG